MGYQYARTDDAEYIFSSQTIEISHTNIMLMFESYNNSEGGINEITKDMNLIYNFHYYSLDELHCTTPFTSIPLISSQIAVTQVWCCMAGSPNPRFPFKWAIPSIPDACITRTFTYLVRAPCAIHWRLVYLPVICAIIGSCNDLPHERHHNIRLHHLIIIITQTYLKALNY